MVQTQSSGKYTVWRRNLDPCGPALSLSIKQARPRIAVARTSLPECRLVLDSPAFFNADWKDTQSCCCLLWWMSALLVVNCELVPGTGRILCSKTEVKFQVFEWVFGVARNYLEQNLGCFLGGMAGLSKRFGMTGRRAVKGERKKPR